MPLCMSDVRCAQTLPEVDDQALIGIVIMLSQLLSTALFSRARHVRLISAHCPYCWDKEESHIKQVCCPRLRVETPTSIANPQSPWTAERSLILHLYAAEQATLHLPPTKFLFSSFTPENLCASNRPVNRASVRENSDIGLTSPATLAAGTRWHAISTAWANMPELARERHRCRTNRAS